MSTTTEPSRKAAKNEKPAKQRIGSPTRSQVRPPVIAAGVAVVVVAALAFLWILNSQTHTRQVFTAASDLPRGHVIETKDLRAVDIPEGQSIKSIGTADQSAVVGKTVVKELIGGAIIAPEQVSNGSGLPETDSIVGLNLTPSQLPSFPLTGGMKVRLITTPANNQAQADLSKEPEAVPATVVSATGSADKNTTLVTVQVPRGAAPVLAVKASSGRIALVLDGGF